MPKRFDVIYTRFSSEMQSPKSCINQEREVRAAMERKGIDFSNAVVISDEAQSGTKSDRDGYERIVTMIQRGQIGILAVDDQSRLGRGDNVFALIKDLVYSGARFISTGENIDTDELGWELRVKVMELHNSTTIQELGRRVHNGQRGRVLEDKSAGDIRFGYESFYVDSDWAQRSTRGPKSVKGIRINDEEAVWVRQIFVWFICGWSINRIARQLTAQKVSKGHRSLKPIWRHSQVHRILACEKYVGRWPWGETSTIRNSSGKKKQIRTPQRAVFRHRPELRIIDDATWCKAQDRLARLKKLFGKKSGQKPRGPRVHHSAEYPTSLLGGLVVCSKCQSRLWQQGKRGKYFLACPNHGDAKGMCTMGARVPVETAEELLLKVLTDVFQNVPEWLDLAVTRMNQAIERHSRLAPQALDEARKRLVELEKMIEGFVSKMEEAAFRDCEALGHRLLQRQSEAAELKEKIQEAECSLPADVNLPNNEWLQDQLNDMASLLHDDTMQAAILLRRLIGKIEAEPVVGPGKKRGYARLTFRIRGCETLLAAMGDRVPKYLADILVESKEECSSSAITVDLGEPSRMEQLAPKIAELREQGVTWKEICKITGLGLGPAYTAWKRFSDVMNKQIPRDFSEDDERSAG